VREVLGGHRPAIWVSDLYSAQRGHADLWQVCLAHQLRDLGYAVEAGDTVFRNGPLGVKPLEQVSRRRVHASVRGRHDGRHTMPSGEEPTSQSLAAWFRPEGSDHLRCPGFVGSRVPATGPRGSRTVRSRSEAARFAPDDYASAASLPKRNSLPSTHRRCRRAESLRARATLARFMPRRLATSSAQRFRVENRPVLVSIACAAS
jgi:hypothetical protein